MTCPACHNSGIRDLPLSDGSLEQFPCPVCKPWANGFPGERVRDRWVIEPAEPGQPAQYNGFPTV